MWGGVKNPGSTKITSSFTRSQGMRENGTKGKEAQQRISPNNSKAQGSNLKELCEERGSFQRELAQGRFWNEAQRNMFQLQQGGALL
jgi:hypothetical protein